MVSDPPLILAFDTSAAHCAAALVQGDAPLAHRTEAMDRGQAERLLPLLAELLAEAGRDWSDLDALALCTGPGNFTGLRIATATARGLALARGIPAIGVTTFDCLAFGHTGNILITLEDRRGDLFTQTFRDGLPTAPPSLAQLADLPPVPRDTLCLGFRAADVAAHLGAIPGPETTLPDPVHLARAAAPRLGTPQPRPAPLYLRRADAAPSSEVPTRVLDDA